LKIDRIARDIAIFLTFLFIYDILKGQPGGQQKELSGFRGGIMKKVALFAVVGLVLWAGVVYGSGKYAEVRPFIEKMAGSFEKFITGMEKAENADAVVAALDAFPKVKEAEKRLGEAMAMWEEPEKPKEEKKEH
jgi:hypothetical protein